VDGAEADVDGVEGVLAGVDADLLRAVLVDALWLALLPQPAAASASETIRQARRTAHKQTRSAHRESP